MYSRVSSPPSAPFGDKKFNIQNCKSTLKVKKYDTFKTSDNIIILRKTKDYFIILLEAYVFTTNIPDRDSKNKKYFSINARIIKKYLTNYMFYYQLTEVFGGFCFLNANLLF
jgi:hypothetical protein